MKFAKWKQEEEPVFQIAPMIDIVFLLVIFFVTTSLLGEIEAEVDLTLPSASTVDQPRPIPAQLLVNIKPDNSIWISNRQRTPEEVERLIKELSASQEKMIVIIRADKNSSHGRFVEVMDACKKAGVRDVRIPVLQKEEAAP